MLARWGWTYGPLALLAMPGSVTLFLPLWLASFGARGFRWRGTDMEPVADTATNPSALPAEWCCLFQPAPLAQIGVTDGPELHNSRL